MLVRRGDVVLFVVVVMVMVMVLTRQFEHKTGGSPCSVGRKTKISFEHQSGKSYGYTTCSVCTPGGITVTGNYTHTH